MRKYPHYGTANDNSFIGDIVRFIDQHAHLKPFEKDLLVNRITERYTADSVEVQIAHLAQDAAVPEMLKAPSFSDELDATPLGTAQEERLRAKLWMEDAARYARNEAYWREKRAYPAEECVRMLGGLLFPSVIEGQLHGPPLKILHDSVTSWPRPENPEQYHEVPTESAKIDDLKWLDNVVPRTANVSKPFTDQRFSVVQEFPGGKLGSVEPKPLMYQDIKDAVARFRKDEQSQFDPNQHIEHISPAEAKQRILSRYGEFVDKARSLIQSWLDKQGHDRCWYYPEIFRELADLFGIKPTVDPQLPSVEAFQGGCQRYQAEQYGKVAATTAITDADVLKLIEYYKSLTVRMNSELWPKITALIDKMEAAIAENAKVGKPLLKTYTELYTAWQNDELPLSDIGLLFVAAHREDKVLSVQVGLSVEVTEESFSSLIARGEESSFQPEIIGGLVAAAIREDKGLKIEVRGGRVLAWQYTFTASDREAGPRHSVVVAKERLDQLEHAEDNLRVLKEHETHSRSMSFAELLDVHQRGAASLQHIGYLFLAAMREDKCFTIKMGPTVEISGSTGTDGPTLREPIESNTCEHGGDHPAPPNKRFCSDACSRCDETEHDAEKQGCAGICGVCEQEPALKIVQGANGDYFVQHKSGLWRIEANGTIGSDGDAAASFREVLKELGTPAGSNGPPSEAEKKEFLESHQMDLGTDE